MCLGVVAHATIIHMVCFAQNINTKAISEFVRNLEHHMKPGQAFTKEVSDTQIDLLEEQAERWEHKAVISKGIAIRNLNELNRAHIALSALLPATTIDEEE